MFPFDSPRPRGVGLCPRSVPNADVDFRGHRQRWRLASDMGGESTQHVSGLVPAISTDGMFNSAISRTRTKFGSSSRSSEVLDRSISATFPIMPMTSYEPSSSSCRWLCPANPSCAVSCCMYVPLLPYLRWQRHTSSFAQRVAVVKRFITRLSDSMAQLARYCSPCLRLAETGLQGGTRHCFRGSRGAGDHGVRSGRGMNQLSTFERSPRDPLMWEDRQTPRERDDRLPWARSARRP